MNGTSNVRRNENRGFARQELVPMHIRLEGRDYSHVYVHEEWKFSLCVIIKYIRFFGVLPSTTQRMFESVRLYHFYTCTQ